MPSKLSIVLLVSFVALILIAQLNISSLLSSLPSFVETDDEASRLSQLQSELRAVQDSRNRLQVQMNSILNMSSSTENTVDPKILATIAQLQTQLQAVKESKDLLELKVNSWMNWNSDPYLGSTANPSLCKNSSKLSEFGCVKGKDKCPGLFDHDVCLDHFPPPGRQCIVYDFGIRENPEFGETLLKEPFNCKVYAFDPSPITKTWYESKPRSKELRKNPNYTLFHYGAGGKDGTVKLNEYDWGQVSIIRFPIFVQKNCTNRKGDNTNCALDYSAYKQKRFDLPVRTLDSIMTELGHDHIDILKVDVEGSEYMFLEHALEHGNLEKVDQLTIEWHHYDYDPRYGGGSTPAINAIVALLNKIGFQQFKIHDDVGGWPSPVRAYYDKGLTLRYNLASFLKVNQSND